MSKQGDRALKERRRELLEILPQVRRFALSLTGNPADGDDLLQATVERLLERGLPDSAGLVPWSIRVCRNLWIDELRAHKVRRKAATLPELTEAAVSGESIALGELALREADRAMAGLPEEQRAVLALVAIEGLSYREAAEVLDVPIGTVMSRLARARAALADRLAERKRAPMRTASKA